LTIFFFSYLSKNTPLKNQTPKWFLNAPIAKAFLTFIEYVGALHFMASSKSVLFISSLKSVSASVNFS